MTLSLMESSCSAYLKFVECLLMLNLLFRYEFVHSTLHIIGYVQG
jgi:hypothetical protein